MKTKIFLVIICAFLSITTQAQFVDDMEYDPGEPLEAWWLNSGDGIDIVPWGHSPTRSGYIDDGGSTDQVLDLGSKTSGEWGISFFAYIPATNGGYFSMLGDFPPNWEFLVGNFYFNEAGSDPGVGSISNPVIGTFEFDYPEAEWFQIILNFDLTGGMAAATWEMYVDGNQAVPPGTLFTAWDGSEASQLGGMDFFSIDVNHQLYLDTFKYESIPIPVHDGFSDEIEYDTGDPMGPWWLNMGAGIDVVTEQAQSGTHSGFISESGVSEQNLRLGSQLSDEWGISYYAYIPQGKEALWSLLGDYDTPNPESLVGTFFFNRDGSVPGVGEISDTALGPVSFTYPEDEWFRVVMNFDLTAGVDAATWQCVIDGNSVIPAGTAFTNSNGDFPSRLGALHFYSEGADQQFYLDTFDFESERILEVAEVAANSFLIYPNPSDGMINIKSSEPIESISIFSSEGKRMMELGTIEVIDISALVRGLYFVQIKSSQGVQFKKIIKK